MNSRRYKLILLLSYFIIINSGLSNAEISKSDSILISLDQIEQLSHDDSTYALNAFNLIAREKIDSALFFKIELACERIRTTPAKPLATVIEAQLLVNGKILVNDYIQIDYLKRIIESVKLSQNNMERDILIRCIGSLRIPYRNSNRIYEGIEYYLNLAKFFEHQNDSLIITNCYYALRGKIGRAHV